MVMLNTSLEYLNTLIKKKLSLKEFENLLFNMGFELDDVKGDEISIELTAERPDLLCTHGLARAINHYLGEKPKKYEIKKSSMKVIVEDSVKKVRPFTVCAVVKNLNFNEATLKEIIDFQEKLHGTFARGRKKAAIGIYPLEYITSPIYYKAEKPEKISFVPLDFSERMTGKEILEKHPKGINYKHLLEGCAKYPIFIDSKEEILSMPPIINSEKLGKITNNTNEVFIECSGHKLETLKKTLNLIVTTLVDFGGDAYSIDVIYKDKKIETPDLNPEKINLKKCNAESMLGIKLSDPEIYSLLKRIGYIIKENKIFAPCYRTDILHEVDVIDDIARAYGPANFIPEFPQVSTIGNLMRNTRIETKARELMVGLGFQEVFTLLLTSSEEQFEKMRFESESVFLDKQVDKSINMMRVSILPELLKVLKTNQHYELPQKIFELGRVVFPDNKSETRSSEKVYLSSVISNSVATYDEISSILNSIFSNINLSYKLKETEDKRFIKGRVAKIIAGKKEIGVIGELCIKVLDNFKLDNPAACFEIDLEFLLD